MWWQPSWISGTKNIHFVDNHPRDIKVNFFKWFSARPGSRESFIRGDLVFNATFNYISAISCRSVLLVEESEYQTVASH